jgi:hypothetical protein
MKARYCPQLAVLKTPAGILARLSQSNLAGLLAPHAEFLASIDLSPECLAAEAGLEDLRARLLGGTQPLPADLAEKLDWLEALSNSEGIRRLEDGHTTLVERLRDPSDSAEDLAVKVVLAAPEVASHECFRQAGQRPRVMTAYRVRRGSPLLEATSERIERLRCLLSTWFGANGRSRCCLVRGLTVGSGLQLTVSHGEPVRTINVIDDAEAAIHARRLRYERQDELVFHAATAEWQVSGFGHRIQECYRLALGEVFHGDRHALSRSSRYSLEPLRDGPEVLAPNFHGAIQYAELAMLRVQSGRTATTFEGPGTFAEVSGIAPRIGAATLVAARLNLKVSGRRRLLPITICPSEDKVSGIHSHPAIEPWLVEKGFSRIAHDEELLVSA